ncbi:unnamed protein product, partial [Onchocerca ochengi]
VNKEKIPLKKIKTTK